MIVLCYKCDFLKMFSHRSFIFRLDYTLVAAGDKDPINETGHKLRS